jgi:hypothetical protein
MKVEKIPSPLPVFERVGDQAAALLLQSVGVTIKASSQFFDSRTDKDEVRVAALSKEPHYQLRSGARGRLSKPAVQELGEAIHLFIEQGPNEKVGEALPELLLAASLSLCGDPYREILDAAQDCIEDAFLLHQIRDRPMDEKPQPQNKVIPFPDRSEPK